jgi:cytoskeleton protein RodZ
VDELCRTLRAARERAGLTIEEFSARTKIGATTLRALESGEYERLPGDFYTRAFLRTYARELQLPPGDVLREYDLIRAPAQPQVADTRADDIPDADSLYTSWTESAASWRKSNAWPTAIFAALLLAVIAMAWRPARTPAAEPGAVATSGVTAGVAHHAPETVTPSAVGTSGQIDAAVAAAASSTGLTIDIRPTADVWVTASTDGKRTIYKLLKAGDHATVAADREIAFRVGNAGAFAYTINGAPGKPIGRNGEVRAFTITPANLGTFRRQ